MPIVPDDKDWTWVVERACPECRFDASAVPATTVADGLRENAAAWRDLLDHPAAGQRPADDRWSALEYACHVRDVYALYDVRLALMLDEDDPTFQNWDQDATAEAERYGEQDPATVLADPAILILDEATSSVDTRTEVLIQHAMARLRSQRTSFVIAHRLSTIRDADTILVMDGGHIVEQGDHASLLASGGAYAALYNAQFVAPVSEVA